MSRNPVRQNCAQPHQCPVGVRLEAMARAPLTRDLDPSRHRALDRYLSAWSWSEDEPMVVAGQEIGGSYLIVSGRARVTRDTADGRELTIDIAAPGDVIGPLHTHPSPATESAWAMETTCALYLPAEALGEVVGEYPELALAILRMQQDRLAQARERKIGQATGSVAQRVAATLRSLDRRLGELRPDGSSLLQVKLRRDDIAGIAGTTVESTSRTMTKMKRDGIIDAGREWVAITDPDALEDLIQGR